MFDGPNAFQNMMQTAVKIKGAQMKSQREKFDLYPTHLQNSMFHKEEIVTMRSQPFEERLAHAIQQKNLGNQFYTQCQFWQAVNKYEEATGAFEWLTNSNDNWKKEGIRDKDITLHAYEAEDTEEEAKILKFQIDCINNIAMAQFKMKQWEACTKACGAALKLQPHNVKALYRRAQALLTDPGAGQLSTNKALKDLKLAHKHAPKNANVNKALTKLRKELAEQKEKDQKNYTGMFNRGTVYADAKPHKELEKPNVAPYAGVDSKTGAPLKNDDFDKEYPGESKEQKEERIKVRFHREVEAIRALQKRYQREGKKKDAAELQKTLDKIEAQMERQKARAEFNFENPTPQMIEDAKKQGIDLTDKDVLHYLQTLQQRRENGESIEDFDSRDEAFMQSQADAENKKSGKRGNVNENGNSKEGGVSRETQTIIAVVMLVFVFYRLASMGLLMPILEYVFGVNSLSMQGEGVEEGDVDDMEDDGGEGAW